MIRRLRRLRYALVSVLLIAIIGAIGWSFAAANVVSPSKLSDITLPVDTSQLIPPSVATPTDDSTDSEDAAIQDTIIFDSPLGTPSSEPDHDSSIATCTIGGIPIISKKKTSICQMMLTPHNGLP